MAQLFNRLPGFTQTPAGFERRALRQLPRLLVFGSLLLALPSMAIRLFEWFRPATELTVNWLMVDIYSVSLIILHWTVIFTVAIAAFIVMVMKGPAYVADAYPLAEQDDSDAVQSGRFS